MSLYQRPGSPFWWFDATVNGVRLRGSTGETGRADARKVERERCSAAEKAMPKRGRWRLRNVIGAYWTDRGEGRASAATIEYQLAKLSEYLGPNTLASALTPAMLTDYRVRRKLDGLAGSSINRELVALRAALTHAHVIHGQPVPELPWGKLREAEPPGRTRFLSRAEYDTLLAASHESLRPIIVCAVTTGLRLNNIIALDWRQIKLADRLIQLRVKGNKAHTVRITTPLAAELDKLPKQMGPVFVVTNFRKRWLAAVKDAKLDDLRFHDLRHTFASWARQAGADIADVKEALGHSDIGMTMRYAHIKPDSRETAFDRVSAVMMAQSTSQAQRKA